MFKNFVETGVMTQDNVNRLIQRVNDISNISWDKNYDYLVSFRTADVLISDFSSLVIEFYITNKPIIYCGENTNAFNSIGEMMSEGLYHVSNKEELVCQIDYLANNNSKY